jgi:prepilin-type N-terminal cleavage/methylation domain-containing protein
VTGTGTGVRVRANAGRGFTLVELAVVVTIVGVLSVLAVVGYRKLTLSAKVSEARNMVAAIRIAQEDYKLERGVYADIGTTYCPGNGGLKQEKTGWDPSCSGGTAKWELLPVHADGPVQFGYATISSGKFDDNFVDISKGDTTRPWYIVSARADLADNGSPYTQVVATSWNSTIFSQNEGD